MSSAAQVTANIANSQRSTGPNTREGKRVASSNSLKHGLTSKQLIITGEDPAAFEDLRASLHSDWKPATTQETLLVDQISQQAWRLQRARRVETASFNRFMPALNSTPKFIGRNPEPNPIDADDAMATAFHSNSKAFDNLRRYETTIERSYYKAMAELRKLQAERRQLEPVQPIGFVSQKPAAVKEPAGEAPQIPASMLKLEIPWKTTSSGSKPYTTLSTPASS
jgi:hypothetical protein